MSYSLSVTLTGKNKKHMAECCPRTLGLLTLQEPKPLFFGAQDKKICHVGGGDVGKTGGLEWIVDI